MWLLHFLPDSFIQFVVHAILLIGVVGVFLSFFIINKILMAFPVLSRYVTVAQTVSALTLLAGVYFEGGYSAEMQWRERVREMEARVAIAEEQADKANAELNKLAKTKKTTIETNHSTVIEYINKEIVKINESCKVPPEAINALNAAAKNKAINK